MATRITVLVDDRKSNPELATEHGFALWIEHGGHQLLFDTGASGRVLVANAAALGIRVEEAEAIVLSHGHYDHTGGLAAVVPLLAGVDLYAHPAVFGPKYTKSGSGWHSIGIGMTQQALEAAGILSRLSEGPQEVFPGIQLTGEVPREARCVPSTPHLYADSPTGRIIDPFHDDQALVLHGDKGLVVVSGCAHAGIVNLCRGAQRVANPRRLARKDHIHAVVGGFHLVSATPQLIDATIAGLREIVPGFIYPSHCTGEPALRALATAFSLTCHPIAAGSVLDL